MYGYLFQDQKEVALGLFQIWIGVGIAVTFFMFEILRQEAHVHVYMWSITTAIMVLTGISYTVLVMLTWSKEQLLPCCFK